MRARLVLLAAALLAFGASLGSGFHFDDYAIFSDPALQSARGWLEVWAPLQTRPLTYFTFWLNRQLGAGDPLGYHLFNLLFHLAAVLLAWECLRRLLPERTALIAGVLFALHPMQSEAVDYVWARGIVLAALFCFAALWQWLDGRPWIALAWFALALLAKEECAAFPLLLVWLGWRGSLRGKFTAARKSPGLRPCDVVPLRATPPDPKGVPRSGLRSEPGPEGTPSASGFAVAPKLAVTALGALAAMFALALAAGARVIWATAVIPGAPAGLQAGISPAQYLLVQGAVICRYLQLFAAPYGFTVDPDISVHLPVGIAAWALLVGATFWLLRRERACATWWIAGLILLIPSSSVFPAADVSADRRMYLPMFAFAAAAALLLARVKAPAVLAGVALLLAGLSVQRTMVWMTEESLWREAVARAPRKLRPKLQLARALPAAQGLELLAKARLDAPYDPAVATETGKILLGEGQPDGALQEFGRALALAPMDARNMNNRGVALLALGQTEAARADFERALRANPSLAEARENLAKLPPRPQ